ncbi:hypothetical protein [Mycobacterium lepromatosis]|nr:hypothetical protein [Mycobacterium lepromatosis]
MHVRAAAGGKRIFYIGERDARIVLSTREDEALIYLLFDDRNPFV